MRDSLFFATGFWAAVGLHAEEPRSLQAVNLLNDEWVRNLGISLDHEFVGYVLRSPVDHTTESGKWNHRLSARDMRGEDPAVRLALDFKTIGNLVWSSDGRSIVTTISARPHFAHRLLVCDVEIQMVVCAGEGHSLT